MLLLIKPISYVVSSCSIETGTSTIQMKIQSEKMKQLLLSDNFGAVPHPVMHNRNLFKTTDKDGNFTFSPEFTAVVEELIKTRTTTKHIFGSSEFAHPRGCLPLKELLIKKSDRSSNVNWILDIIITYRRLHDKLPSNWNQMFKYHRDENGIPNGSHKKWPDEGGIRIIPFDEYVAKDNFIQKSANERRQRYNKWNTCADSVTIVNYHENKVLDQRNGTLIEVDLMTNFVCNGMIGANRTCSYIKNNQRKEAASTKNPSVDLGHEILAIYAHESGLIPQDWKRQATVAKIKQFIQRNEMNNVPMRCPNATIYEKIYEESLKVEKWAIARIENQDQPPLFDTLDSVKQQQFDLGWQHLIDQKTFCTLDVVKVSKKEEWQKFFASF